MVKFIDGDMPNIWLRSPSSNENSSLCDRLVTLGAVGIMLRYIRTDTQKICCQLLLVFLPHLQFADELPELRFRSNVRCER